MIIKTGASVTGIGIDEASSSNKTMSNAYYLQALGEMGLGKDVKAKQLLEKSLAEYKNNIWAKYYFEQTNYNN